MQRLRSLRAKIKSSPKIAFYLLLGVSVSVLLISFFAEYYWKLIPCKLCNVQRSLYAFLGFFSLLGIFSSSYTKSCRICAIILAASCVMATYHALIQFGILQDRCSSHTVADLTAFEAVLTATPISCAQKSWKIIKIPVSVYNGFLSFFLLILILASKKWLTCHCKIGKNSG